MNDQQLDDLKQFIETTVSQTGTRLGHRIDDLDQKLSTRIDALDERLSIRIEELDQRLSDRIDELEATMNDGFAGVGEAIESISQRIDDHENRPAKLAHHTA